jgi:hypothetical protein
MMKPPLQLDPRPSTRRLAGRTVTGLLVILALAVSAAGAAEPAVREIPLPTPEMLGPEVPATWPVSPAGPEREYNVGDPLTLWVFIHVGTPHFEQRAFTVRGKTAHGYVVVDNAEWNARMFQSDVDAILDRWENTSPGPTPDLGIYEIDSTNFGEPPNELDGDVRIFLVWFDFGNATDGFFFYFDEYPDGTFGGMRSNERECLYLNTDNGQDPGGEYMIAVAAHEFEHMIHWKYDENEDSWVNEGLAELAMWLYGHPDEISVFNTNADNPLTTWGGNWADYIKTYLWSLYFYERYGGQPSVYAAVHQPLNSIAGYDAVLDQFGYTANVSDVFADWAVANFLDDPTLQDGRFGYLGEDLPDFLVMGTHSTYPVTDQSKSVGHWATDYYRFTNLTEMNGLHLEFDGANDNRFAVWGLGIAATMGTSVSRMTLDPATQAGTLDVLGLQEPGDQIILVVAGCSGTGGTSYIYRASESAMSVPEFGDLAAAPLRLEMSPNPSQGTVAIRLNWNEASRVPARVDLFDAAGRLIRSLTAEPALAGAACLAWDGTDRDGRHAASGIYYARARAGARTAETRLVRLP